MTTVTIRECKTNGQRFVYRSRASDAEEAIARAVKARYGTKAWFKQDHGLADGYGVVLVPTAQPNAYNVVSPRVLVEASDDATRTAVRAAMQRLPPAAGLAAGRSRGVRALRPRGVRPVPVLQTGGLRPSRPQLSRAGAALDCTKGEAMKDIWRNGDRWAEVYRSTCWTGINCPRKACYNVRGVRLGVTEFVTRQSAHARLIKLGFTKEK